jgi:hypothetical protein
VHKSFTTFTSGVLNDQGIPGDRIGFDDSVDSTTTVPASGRFTWSVNPSTRPLRAKDQTFAKIDPKPRRTIPIANTTPAGGVPAVGNELVEFEVKADEPHDLLQVRVEMGSAQDDYDIVLYKDTVDPKNQVGASGGGNGATENISLGFPEPGKYVLEVDNFAAATGWHGNINLFGSVSTTVDKSVKEAYTLTCERADGTVLASRPVIVDRGQTRDLGPVCVKSTTAGGSSRLGLSVAIDNRLLSRALGRGLRVRAKCSLKCALSLSLTADAKTAKRLHLGNGKSAVVVAKTAHALKFKGRRTVVLRFTRAGKKRLARVRTAKLTLNATARGTGSLRQTASRRVRLRR